MTLQEAKDEVAKIHGFTDFGVLLHSGSILPSLCYGEAAELYAKSQWNEAIEAAAESAEACNDEGHVFMYKPSILKLKK